MLCAMESASAQDDEKNLLRAIAMLRYGASAKERDAQK